MNGVKKRIKDRSLNQTAYHGSPAEFESFDSSHIGEGEGHQAFGCGLYLTNEKGILKLLNNNGIENNELAEALAYKVLRIESIEGIYSYIEDLLLNTESAVERNKNSRQSELVNEIIRITKENCESRTFSIDIVAEKLGMTSAYLGKVFKRTTGETFSRFVLNERMTIACRLLAETDEPIDSIIYSVGFGDTPYFYKLFKQLNGCTPAKYRETHRTQ